MRSILLNGIGRYSMLHMHARGLATKASRNEDKRRQVVKRIVLIGFTNLAISQEESSLLPQGSHAASSTYLVPRESIVPLR